MTKGIIYMRFVENQIQIGTNKKTSWKGKMKHEINDRQMRSLRKYVASTNLKDLADFLNIPEKYNSSRLIVVELLWAFSKNKSIDVVADDSYAERISQKGIKEINQMLKKGRNRHETGECFCLKEDKKTSQSKRRENGK